ncbi:MAG: hypothetical protein ACKV22_32065 [Bryobacteraceae bacterium]
MRTDLFLILLILPAQAELSVEKRILGQITRSAVGAIQGDSPFSEAAVSDDGRHLARVRYAGSRQLIDLDGVESQQWDEIGAFGAFDNENRDLTKRTRLIFSPRGDRLAYLARDGTRVVLVVDNKPVAIDPNSLQFAGSFRFSGDGSRYAMIVSNPQKAKTWVVVDGVTEGPYGFVKQLTFSGDGKHLAYVAYRSPYAVSKDGAIAMVDGKSSPVYQNIHSLQLSFDGRHSAFAAESLQRGLLSEGWRVVVDGSPSSQRFREVSALQLSADGRNTAYVGVPTLDGPNPSGGPRVFVDGKAGPEFEAIEELKLSPDGARHAYVGQKNLPGSGRRAIFVIDGRESRDYPLFDTRNAIYFSPDSKSVAFDAFTYLLVDGQEHPGAGLSNGVSVRSGTSGPAFAYRTKGDDSIVRVALNGKAGPALTNANLNELAFTPDGTAAAYPGIDLQGKPVLFAAGKTFPLPSPQLNGFRTPDLPTMQIRWSADGAHFALAAADKVIVDGIVGPACRFPSMPLFSPDAKHFAYACQENQLGQLGQYKSQWVIYLDGKRAATADALFRRQPGTWKFSSDGTLELLAVVGIEVQSLHISPPAGGLTMFGLGTGSTTQIQTRSAATGPQPAANSSPQSTDPHNSRLDKAREAVKNKLPRLIRR